MKYCQKVHDLNVIDIIFLNYDWYRYKLDHILLLLIMYMEALVLHLLKCIKNVLHRWLMVYFKATTLRFLPMDRLVQVKHTQWVLAVETPAKQGSYLKLWTLSSPRLRLSKIRSSFKSMFLSSRLVLNISAVSLFERFVMIVLCLVDS